jgi:beta-glucosidase/6-phospho-beta-glucosidase/beta-galactosidase
MFKSVNEDLLRLLAMRGEMPARDLALMVDRKRNDYTDFYGLAAMLQAGYMATDSSTELDGRKEHGVLGLDMQETAVSLCQISMAPGTSFTFNDCPRESWHDFPVKIFITSNGLLKLEELDQREESRKQRRFDYIFAVVIAILAALASGYFTSIFSP